jgi:endonuclease G, mitochondrial
VGSLPTLLRRGFRARLGWRDDAGGGGAAFVYGGAPRTSAAYPHTVRVLENKGYLVGYAEALASPVWAAYRMRDLTPLPEAAPRPGHFEADGRTLARVEPSVYLNSGYDRGHLAPNYAIATRYGAEAQRETFLLSNVIPQRHGLNAGLWKQLEQRAATSYPARFGEVWVVAGPVFGPHPARLPHGGPAVPEACFMIVTDESEGRVRAMAFLFPQEPAAGAELERYVTTVDEIERRTGLDFFSALDDATETALESRRVGRVW